MYIVPKGLAQNVVTKVQTLNQTQHRVLVFDTDGVYKAKWDSRGVHVAQAYKPDELDYFHKVELNKPHLVLKVLLNKWIIMFIVVWSTPDRLQYLRDSYLLDYVEAPDNYDEIVAEVEDVRD